MLRRTKAELSKLSSFNLPSKTFHVINVELYKEEKEAYEKVLLFSRCVQNHHLITALNIYNINLFIFSSLFAKYLYEKAEKENAVERGFSVKNKINYLHRK